MSETPATDQLRPMTPIQIEQTREFVASLDEESEPYWDMVEVGDELSRDLHMTPELIILYADGIEDYNPWYEGWKMNTWQVDGESPFGGAIVPLPILALASGGAATSERCAARPIGNFNESYNNRN